MEVGIRELRDGLSKYLAAVREGQAIAVTDHGRVVAQLIPVQGPTVLEKLIAEGRVTRRAKSRRFVPKPLVADGTVSDLISDQRR